MTGLGDMMKKILIFVLALLPTAVLAADCTLYPEEFWIGNDVFLTRDYINITCNFTCNSIATAQIGSYPPIELEKIGSVFNSYMLLPNDIEAGVYAVIMQCGAEFETKNMTVNRLQLSLLPSSPSYSVLYPRDTITIFADFRLNGAMITSNTRTSFKVFLGEELDIVEAKYGTDYWRIIAKIPDSFSSFGMKNLKVNASYGSYSVAITKYDYANVKELLSVKITDPSPLNTYRLTDATDINVTVNLLYKSVPLGPSSVINFAAELDGTLAIRNVKYIDPSHWVLTINVPELTPSNDKYQLDIFATYDDVTRKATLEMQSVLLFEGNVVNADNSAVKAEIRLKGNNIEEIILTDSSGNYQAEVLPGEYEVELLFPDMRARLSDVVISGSEDLFSITNNVIRYDSFSDDTKKFFLEFNLPFNNIYIVIPYQDSDFVNENEIFVYKCDNWNFFQRLCSGEWKKIGADIDEVKNLISFTLNSLSAFSVGETGSLKIDASLEEYYAGDDIILTGKTLDNKDNIIGNVKINYTGTASGSVVSDQSGRFTIIFKAPDTEGEHYLTLEAGKNAYIPAMKTLTFSVVKKKSLALTVPGSISLDMGSASSLEITVKNNGQVDLEDIDIIIENIPTRWYNLSKNRIEKLGSGEEAVISMSLLVDDCGNCKNQYYATVKAESSVSATASFVINLGIPKQAPVTGFAIDSPGQYLLIIAVIAAVLAYWKFKFNTRTSRNQSVMTDLRVIREEALRKQELPEKERTDKKTRKIRDILKNPFSN